jgi:hypothetical protein
LALDLSELIQVLSAMSSLAVIAGVVFVVFQLRQNAKLIEASNRQLEISNRQVEASIQQNRQQVLLSLVDRYTTDAYNFRRRTVREIIRKYSGSGWKDYLESNDDFEVRALLNQYESTGFLAKSGIVDVKTLREGLGLVIEYDWNVLQPAVVYYGDIFKRAAFPNFEWLATALKEAELRAADIAGPRVP